MPPWSETTPGSSAYATCDRCPSVPAITPQQPSPLAEAKARFAASRDLATLQVAEIEQVALPSPPGFVVLPTEWSDPCDLRQVLRACPQGRDPTRTSQSDVSSKLRIDIFQPCRRQAAAASLADICC